VNPAYTLYYEENVGRFTFLSEPPGTVSPCDQGTEEGVVRGWHGRDWIFNVSFADAHAGTVRMKGFENPHLSDYPGDGTYNQWHCVIIRGRGWARDTLPAPDVWTPIPCQTIRDSVE
jgi:hypothetical protein